MALLAKVGVNSNLSTDVDVESQSKIQLKEIF